MPTAIQENIKKSQLSQVFDVHDNGNITLKEHFGIPQFTLIYVEGGEFIMGDDEYEDAPKHKVNLSSFYIGEYPVTQELFAAVAGDNPGRLEGLNHPVENVSWLDAVKFCNVLNRKIGLTDIFDKEFSFLDCNGKKTNSITEVEGFRLPTEAEWEYAAKGGNALVPQGVPIEYQYAGGNCMDDIGWYDENNLYETKPVGLKFPNALGIYDMSGHVLEWCWDWYDKDFYKKPGQTNPVNNKEGSGRVVRGGSWNGNADYCRMASRFSFNPVIKWEGSGFRLVFTLKSI